MANTIELEPPKAGSQYRKGATESQWDRHYFRLYSS